MKKVFTVAILGVGLLISDIGAVFADANRRSNRAQPVEEAIPSVMDKCRFLFIEWDCPAVTVSPSAPTHIKKAEKMIGMNAYENRHELKQYFAAKIDEPVDPKRIPWCAAWVNAVLADAGLQTTDSLLARSFLNYGQKTKQPKQGDIVVLTRGRSNWTGHVGFYVDRVVVDGVAYVAVLGGNQNKGINIAFYPESRVLGYRTVS